MILAIDIGNTTVALGGIRDGRVCFVARMDTVRTRTAAEYRAEMDKIFAHRRHPERPLRFEGAVLTSVVPQITGALAECARHYTGRKPVIISPEIHTGLTMGVDEPHAVGKDRLVDAAMNTGMLENPITQDNLATLQRYGFTVIPSESGVLACKDVGSGRLPKEDVLLEYILHTIARPKDLAGLRVAVTAGPTQEALDPVRYLTNHSTGKMGYALARAAAMRGADVTLIHGETALQPVRFTTDVPVTTAQQMYEAVTSRFEDTDVLIMAAAVADYRPAAVASDKIKKKDGDMSIPLERTPDILGTIGPRKAHQFLCGFSMETRDLVENSSAKLTRKNLDMVVANNLKVAGAGFGVDTNVVTLITPDGARELPLMSKADVADAILDEILKRKNR